jgi:ABC-type glycerol-3-phosphate transport system substrate-binding protein
MKGKVLKIAIGVIVAVAIVIGVIFLVRRFTGGTNSGEAALTYWGVWEDAAVFEEVINDFEAENPGITVKYEKQDIKNAPGGYVGFLQSRIRSGTGPDILRFHNSWTAPLRSSLAPFPKDTASAINIEENYFPVVQEDMVSNGAYYGVPIGYDSLVMYVNDEILSAAGREVPQSWNELLDSACALTVTDPATGEIQTAGVALGTYDNIAHAGDIISMLIIQNGVDVEALAGFRGTTTAEKQTEQERAKTRMVGVLDFYTYPLQSAACQNGAVWSQDLPNSKLAFVEGKLAFYFGYSWDVLEISREESNLQYSIHPVPKLSTEGKSGSTVAGYWVEGVSMATPNKEQAFKFLEFLSKPESIEKIYKAQASQRPVAVAYPRRDMAKLLESNPYLAPVVASGSNASSSVFYSDTYDGSGLTGKLDVYLGNAVRSIISPTNSVSSATAVDTLASGVATVFADYAQ